MTRRFFSGRVSTLFLGMLVLALAAASVSAASQPRIKFKHETWDFGKVKQGTTVEHEFVFKNTGSAKLTIAKVETSCGCTAALASQKTLEPGEEGKIQVALDLAGYSGPVTKYIYVDSDDPENPRFILKINADVDVPPAPRAEISPYSQDVGLVLEGEEVQAKLTLRNRGELELQVDNTQKNVVFLAGSKRVTFPLKIASGKEVTLSLKMSLPNRVGPLKSEYVTFKTNDPQQASVYFTLNGYIATRDQLKDLFQRYKDILK